MLAFYMLSHGLRRLEGELNTFRLQKNGQAGLEIDASALPQSYYLRTLTLTEPDWEQILNAVNCPLLRKILEASVVTSGPTGSESASSCRQAARSPAQRSRSASTFDSIDAVFATMLGSR